MNLGTVHAGARRAWLDSPLAAFALTLLYLLAWLLLLRASNSLWYLPAGLRLGALWLAAGEWSALTMESVREQVREMQESLRRVLRQLRPQALDTHGLREAIGFGPLRDTAEEAGIG